MLSVGDRFLRVLGWLPANRAFKTSVCDAALGLVLRSVILCWQRLDSQHWSIGMWSVLVAVTTLGDATSISFAIQCLNERMHEVGLSSRNKGTPAEHARC